MPYGLAQADTVEYVTEKEKAGNVSDRIELESEKSNYTLSVIIDGALYEEFDFWSDGYAVNVADWVAELTEREGITDFDVMVSEIDSPDCLYRKSGFTY